MSRELDREVAEKVMGWRIPETWLYSEMGHDGEVLREVPLYSSSIEAAWLVMEKMREKGWSFGCSCIPTDDTWIANFGSIYISAPTAPEAICRAALAALAAVEGT